MLRTRSGSSPCRKSRWAAKMRFIAHNGSRGATITRAWPGKLRRPGRAFDDDLDGNVDRFDGGVVHDAARQPVARHEAADRLVAQRDVRRHVGAGEPRQQDVVALVVEELEHDGLSRIACARKAGPSIATSGRTARNGKAPARQIVEQDEEELGEQRLHLRIIRT